MKIGFLVFNIDGAGGTSRSAITQATALAGDHDVRIVSITRSADQPHYAIDPAITVDYLVDVRDPKAPKELVGEPLDASMSLALHGRESALVPARWDRQFTALTDIAMEALLPTLDVDVAVSVTPGLLAAAVELLPAHVIVIHQEHRSSSARTGGLEPLLTYAPRADVVALLTDTMETWLRGQLGELAPPTVVMPNPLPIGFKPRSSLDQPVIMAAGRLMPEKQFGKLVQAFAEIADEIPDWRLRIYGEGKQRLVLLRLIRRLGLWDRVELPGNVRGLHTEWARASIAAISSSAEGLPLVAQEAMACGVPVVSFDCASGPRALIEHEVNGLLVAPQSIQGLSSALLRLAQDAELRSQLGLGAVRSSAAYDAHSLAEQWIGIFAEAKARRSSAGRLTARALTSAPRPAVASLVEPVETIASETTPEQARTEALAWCTAAAAATDEPWFVIPAHERPAPIVVVPMTGRTAFLAALGGGDAPAYLSLRDPGENGWPEARGTLADLGQDLARGRTSVLYVEPWPEVDGLPTILSHGCSVEVQFWEAAPNGELVAPRRNPYFERVSVVSTSSTSDGSLFGLVERRPEPVEGTMAEPNIFEVRFPIDVVYTWVDGNDDAWNAARETRLAEVTGTQQTRESSGRARFVNRNELRYSLRSIHLFAPWVRKIHLVTAGQHPSWLAEHPMINLVDHEQILPADGLPTFNSHAIETSLHRIDGLAEHFLYFNDDFFLGRPMRPEQFFSPAGATAVFLSDNTIGPDDTPDAAPYLLAAHNNRRLLQAEFGVGITNNLAHAPYAHRVSTLQALTEQFPAELAATARSPFRSATDVSTLSSLAQHYGLITGTAFTAQADLDFINLSNPNVDWQLKHALHREHEFLCLSEPHDHALLSQRLDGYLSTFYDGYFPIVAPWER